MGKAKKPSAPQPVTVIRVSNAEKNVGDSQPIMDSPFGVDRSTIAVVIVALPALARIAGAVPVTLPTIAPTPRADAPTCPGFFMLAHPARNKSGHKLKNNLPSNADCSYHNGYCYDLFLRW